MIEIEKHLKKYGYNLDYSYNDFECSIALKNELGGAEYKKFWKSVKEYESTKGYSGLESHIRTYLDKHPKAIKILLSGQIAISVEILKVIIQNLKEDFLTQKFDRYLELGGGDGWASDYLTNMFPAINEIEVVDINYDQNKKNQKVILRKAHYKEFHSIYKYDFIYSILGIDFLEIDELVQCLKNNVNNNGIIYLGLRIQPNEYTAFQEKMDSLGFKAFKNGIERVCVNLDSGRQVLPLFKFQFVK